ncbi:MAG: dTMP kinase [Ignavibacteriae bacterium]|nr:dTMP kinase [Ignavibacteriota bacterium]
MFITFEGLDFCGKSTQVKLLKKYFEDKNKTVKLIREPGGVKISEKIRDILLDIENDEMVFETELLLFSASRAQLVRESILPFLDKGDIVISDRFHDSSIAYQGYGRGINPKFVIDLQNFAIGSAIPEITFFIDIPIEEVLKRKGNISESELDRIEVSQNNFYEKVREGYKLLAANEERFLTLDGLMSIEEISKRIISKIEQMLKER